MKYGDRYSLGPLDLTISRGERVGIIGPSGAGKSTLLRLIMGEVTPTSGTVEVAGSDLTGMTRRERANSVGLMHQRLDLIPQISARQNIEAGNYGKWSTLRTLVGLLAPVHDLQSRNIAERVGLSEKLSDRTSRLSGGQQQRVALARLLVQNPELMLVDEPVSSLDPTLSEKMLDILCGSLGGESDRRVTVVVSMHDPKLALRFFDRIVGIVNGRIVLDKAAEQVSDSELDQIYSSQAGSSESPTEQVAPPVLWGRD